ncbi:MAG: HAD-IA family hydrolase [Anaerohalosphaeraceae bacterium]
MTNGRDGLPYGVIFDMDGVLVDSEEFLARAACQMFAEYGLKVRPEDFVPFIGTGETRYLGGVAEKYGLAIDLAQAKERTYDIYLQIIRGALKPLPGVHSFLKRCRTLGKKIAVASSADRRKVEGNLREIGLGFDSFDAVVTGEDAARKKPAPDLFLTAASRLNLPPQSCLVIEDAVSGVQAAKAAGMRCLALTTSFPKEALTDADFIAADLSTATKDVLHWKEN